MKPLGLASVLSLLLLAASVSPAGAQSIPTTLTDRIYSGHGIIDLLKDVSAENLAQYFNAYGQLMLAIDVNEAASGNETANSQGLAISQLRLVITTTAGDFTFSDFYTSTTASLMAAGSTTAQQYYTVFGQGGNTINGSTTDFTSTNFDDVIYLSNVNFTGTILSASLQVSFLQTASAGRDSAESFFDFSNGPEDFAILGAAEANALEAENVGVSAAPGTLSFTATAVEPVAETSTPPVSPGAPAPPYFLLAALAGIAALRMARAS